MNGSIIRLRTQIMTMNACLSSDGLDHDVPAVVERSVGRVKTDGTVRSMLGINLFRSFHKPVPTAVCGRSGHWE